ncbi:MAG: FecR domain-containing protein [Deltaproteobacteria bacterium]|nr:FecR domain-containing protein [Deltaproteobacteria bacterium]
MRKRGLLRHGWFPFFTFLPFLLFWEVQADEFQIIKVRKGDTVSYLSFKIYGRFDPRLAELLKKENPRIKDIDWIYPGQEIRFPSPEAMNRHLSEKLSTPMKDQVEAKEPPPPKELLAKTPVRFKKGVITFLEGQVQVKKAEDKDWTSARPNMIVTEKDQIKVLDHSRAELILDNQAVMRLSENTLLTIEKLEEERTTQKETTRMGLPLGTLWVRVTKLFNRTSRYDVSTPTAIAGVQGTTYQVQVNKDRVTSIQVFQGAVNVYNPFPAPSLPGSRLGRPQEVKGPVEVPGPITVSRAEWTKIVLQQFQRITVTEQHISPPNSFDILKEREKEWIRWNEERDLDFSPPESAR